MGAGYHHITGGPRSTAAKTNEIQSELSCIAIKKQLDDKWNECRSEGQTLHISLDVSIRQARRGQTRGGQSSHCTAAALSEDAHRNLLGTKTKQINLLFLKKLI